MAAAKQAEAPIVGEMAGAAANMPPGEFQAGLDAVARAAADPNVSAEQLLAMSAAGELVPAAAPAGPAVALEAVAPRAPMIQQGAVEGMQSARETAQTGVTFQQVGSEIVAAINAGTEVSKSMLGVLNRIAEKSAPEFAFQ
jgi:hypothetical protein